MAASILNFFQPLIIRAITDKGMMEGNMKDIIFFSSLLMFTSMMIEGLGIIRTSLFVKVHNELWEKMYNMVYQKLSKLPLMYYAEKDSAEIINTIGSDISSVSL